MLRRWLAMQFVDGLYCLYKDLHGQLHDRALLNFFLPRTALPHVTAVHSSGSNDRVHLAFTAQSRNKSVAMGGLEDMFPAWMVNLYTCPDYFQSCDECWHTDGGGLLVKGKIPAKYQKNFFVLQNGLRAIACSHCKDMYTGEGTLRIQIRRSSHHGTSP